MNWDDLRIVLAIRDTGTFAGASARLRIDETTVARRLMRIQSALGVRLFDAVDGVRRPTPQCEIIFERIQNAAFQIAKIDEVSKQTAGIVGRIRIASTNSVMEEILAPRVAGFLLDNPGIILQLKAGNENVDFSRWQADIAIRLKKPDKGDFIVTRIADLQLYFFSPRGKQDLEALVCAYPSELDQTPESLFLNNMGAQSRARCVTDNIRTVRALIRSYAFCGVLPEYFSGDLLDDPRLTATRLPEQRQVWLLVQRHLKVDPAARLVVAWVKQCFQELAR
jgi:DNA-binding transcriptional LysR family regulator